MINVVLLEGFLSREKLEKALAEIKAIDNSDNGDDGLLRLVVSSTEGHALAAVDFVEGIQTDTDFTDIEIKVYEAISTAAFIVLALAGISEVEMNKNAALGIHRGEIRLSPTQISPDGKIDEKVTTDFKRYDAALLKAMGENGLTSFNHPNYLSQFYATDWLRLTPGECLQLGIVDKLF